jgi:hypothetical protein
MVPPIADLAKDILRLTFICGSPAMSVVAVIATAGPAARDPEGGLPNKLIAHELGVTEATVKAHVSLVLLKFNVYSRARVIAQMSGTADLEG